MEIKDMTTRHEQAMTLCKRCGMRADLDPGFHAERYGHWPETADQDPSEQSEAIEAAPIEKATALLHTPKGE